MYAQPSVTNGLWDKVSISDVRDAGSFTVKLCGSEEEFNKMMGDVQKVCIGSSTPSPSTAVNDAILAQFSFDNQWYRAQVKCVNGDGTLQVTYVDYGNEETVDKRNTRCAKSSFSLPRQGVTCVLNRIDYSSKGMTQSHHDTFRSMCLNNNFAALFLNNTGDERWSVELFHPSGNVNDWFGKLSGSLLSPVKEHKQPTKLPHPHNAGLIAAKPAAPALPQIKKVEVPTRFEGAVVFANSPSEFWLQSNNDGDAVMDMSAQLAEHCNNTTHRLAGSPVVGQYCAALYNEDMAWYRARVMEASGARAKVYFVDYGNMEEINLSNLADLPSQLTSQPEYAIQASLEGVAPAAGDEWTDDSINAFSDSVLVATCQVQVVGKPVSDTYLVTLTVNGESTADMLVAEGHAKSCAPGNKASTAASHTPAYSGGYSHQQVESSQKETVFISWLPSPAAFWVQKAGCDDVLATLLDAAKESAAGSEPISSPAVGMACVAKYSADGDWYRGEIEACLAQSCTVSFIDYGNSEDISVQDIHPATAAIAETPVQAFKCSLLGIVPFDKEWSDECNALIEQLMAEGGSCTFLARHGDSYLVEMTYNEQESLQDALVNAKMAKRSRASSQMSDRSQGSHHSSSSVGRPKNTAMTPVRQVEKAHHADGGGDRAPADEFHLPGATMSDLGLKVGDKIEGSIVHINNAKEIYVQLIQHKQQLDTVYDAMGVFYHGGKGKHVSEVVVDGCYVVQFVQDNEWYRARVLSVNSASIEVFYVDYGNTEITAVEKVRALSPEFARLPCQGLCCSLHNYNRQLIDDELKTFKDTYVYADVTGVIQSGRSNGVMVDLFCGDDSLAELFAARSLASSANSTPQRPHRPLKFSGCAIKSPGDVVGFLTFEVSQQEFYIQLTADTELLEEVTEKVLSESSTSKQITSPAVNQACIAKFGDDGVWYRAEITECTGEEVTVFFVDFGNSSLVDRTEILQISEALSQVRPLAIRCRLVTEDASKNLTEWAADELTITVQRVEGGTAFVGLTDTNNMQFSSISMSNGIHSGSSSVVSSQQSSHPSPSRPNVDSCLHFAPQPTYKDDLSGYLVFEVSQQEFYIQLTADTELLEEVTEKVLRESHTSKQITSPAVNQACIAKFRDDGVWYRAEITECTGEEVTVFFVDFGNSSLVDRTEILQISEDLSQIRPLAIRCRLVTEDASKNLTEWAADELQIRIEHLQDGTYYVSLDISGSPFTSATADSSNTATPSDSKASSISSSGLGEHQLCRSIADHPQLSESNLGFLSFEVSQQEFYIQLTADTELLEEVTEKVVSESSTSKQITSPAVSQACIARFRDDDAWYRAEITECTGEEVTVFFVDFGNSSLVDRTEILQISKALSEKYRIAIRCQLITEDTSKSLTDWAVGELTIDNYGIHDGTYHVSLKNSDESLFTIPASDPSNSAIQSPHGSDKATPTSNDIPSTSPSPADSQPCLKFPACKLLPTEVTVYLSVEISQLEFYIQLSEDVLLLEQLTGSVQTAALSLTLATSLQVGQACIAKFRDDNAWYRAEITECTGEEVTVFFVDFGNSSLVDRTEILQISEDLRQIPPFATRCALAQVDASKSLTQWAVDMVCGHVHVIVDGVTYISLRDGDGPFSDGPVKIPHSSTVSAPFVYPIPTTILHKTLSEDNMVSLPDQKVLPGEYKGYVAHIQDLNSIYVQLSCRSEELSYISEQLAKLGPSAEPEVYCHLGQACMSTYSVDGLYYRGIVIETNEKDGTSLVLFIDYGTTAQVNNSKLKVLPPSLRDQSPVAVQCKCEQDTVVAMNTQQLADEVNGKELSLHISGDTEPYILSILDLGQGGSDSNAADQSETSKFTASPIKYKELAPAVPSSNLVLNVSHIVNPSHFYCHLDADSMNQLQASLDAAYVGNDSLPQLPEDHLVSGASCVVLSKKRVYSRALLLADKDAADDMCQVLLVDHGITESIACTGIYQLHQSCVDSPRQAVRCSLRIIHPLAGSVWDDDAICRFYELVDDKQLLGNTVKVREVADDETEIQVQLMCSEESICETLINAGFCSKIPTADTPVDKFCSDLCTEVKEKILSSSENRTAFLSDKSELFVNSLHSALDTQLHSMQEDEEGSCTAQDIVHHVTHKIINDILDLTQGADLNLQIANKDVMKVEIQNIVAELLEEVMRMNNAIVENLIDDGLSSADNIGRLSFGSDEETSTADVPSFNEISQDNSVREDLAEVEETIAKVEAEVEETIVKVEAEVEETIAKVEESVEVAGKVKDSPESEQEADSKCSTVDDATTDDVTADDATADDATTDDFTGDDLTGDDLTGDYVTGDDVTAGDVTADVTTDDVTADVTTDDVTADDITTDDVTAGDVTADDVTTDDVAAGNVTTDDVTTHDVTADDVTTDDVTADHVSAHDVTADDVTTHDVATRDVTDVDDTIDDVPTDAANTDAGVNNDSIVDNVTADVIVTDTE